MGKENEREKEPTDLSRLEVRGSQICRPLKRIHSKGFGALQDQEQEAKASHTKMNSLSLSHMEQHTKNNSTTHLFIHSLTRELTFLPLFSDWWFSRKFGALCLLILIAHAYQLNWIVVNFEPYLTNYWKSRESQPESHKAILWILPITYLSFVEEHCWTSMTRQVILRVGRRVCSQCIVWLIALAQVEHKRWLGPSDGSHFSPFKDEWATLYT